MMTYVRKWQNNSANNYLVVIFRIIVGGIFVLAGVSKLIAPLVEFIAVADAWGILPDPWLTLYAWTLPWAEVIFGLGLVVGAWHRLSAAMVGLMIVSFLVGIEINFFRGKELVDCGCFGQLFSLGETFQELWWRDVALLLMTAWIGLMPKPLKWSVDGWLTKSKV